MKAALRGRDHVPIRLVPSRTSLPYRRRSGRQPLGRHTTTKPSRPMPENASGIGRDGRPNPVPYLP